jgi:ABC-2 type transport system ATP-binding protein
VRVLDGRIVVSGLVKEYGSVRAVDDLSFIVEPGRVTGFLGPNGAGKTTTLRMVLDLIAPSGGTATVSGRRYRDLVDPVRHVGAVLEASGAHRGRSGRNHLRMLCYAAGLPTGRADDVIDKVGITAAARRPVGTYSLGTRQRLGIAAALLGDPDVIILDEPANGLDPEGIRWMRDLLKNLADEGRTILVSSHVLSEMQLLADDVIIVAAGKLIIQGSLAQVIASTGGGQIRVRTSNPDALVTALRDRCEARPGVDGWLIVTGADTATVGETALRAGVAIYEIAIERPDLESVFLQLTAGKAEIR